MYDTLKKLKNRINLESWKKMVEQAREKEKLTKEEYESLTKSD